MYLVSACLAGCPCRYDSKANTIQEVVDLVNSGQAIPICPEQLGGLSTPRIPAEIKHLADHTVRVVNNEGSDITNQFLLGAKRTLAIAKSLDIKKAILKAKSPSCGKGFIYDGSFTKKLIQGNGITASLLMENDIMVSTELDFKID